MSKKPAKKTVAKKPAAKKSAAKKTAVAKKVPVAISAKKKASTKKDSPTPKSPTKSPLAKKLVSEKASPPKARKKSAKSAKKASDDVIPTNVAEAVAAVETKKANSKDSQDLPPPVAAVGFSLDDVRSILDRKKVSENKKEEPVDEPSIRSAKVVAVPKPVQPFAKNKNKNKNKNKSASVADILGFNPKKSTTRPDRDASKVPAGWKPFYISLIRLRDQLKVGLGARSEDTIGASARESSGELSVNSSDAGSESFDRDVAITMVAGEQEMLQEVESAIDRIFDGTYGVCEETGKPIKQSRLKAVPYTRFSLEGQADYEQHGRTPKDVSGAAFATLSEASSPDDDG